MIAGLLSVLLPLLHPDVGAAEAVLLAGLLTVAVAVLAVLRALGTPTTAAHDDSRHGFAELRVLLRASDPDAAGHPRARAPGTAH